MSKIYIVGSINMDLIINTDTFPDAGMTVTGYGFMENPGGKGANQAVAVSKCGGDAVMVGSVGNAFGEKLVETLKNYGVDTKNVALKDGVSSGIAVITVTNGENRIIIDKGSNALVEKEAAFAALKDATCDDYLIVQLEIPVSTVLESLRFAKYKGMTTVVNPAPACQLPSEVFALADYFIPNQTETRFYTGIYPDTPEKARLAAKELLNKGVKHVIITLGGMGAASVTEDDFSLVPAYTVKAVDTTAAGDTFVGALVTRLAEKADVLKAMDFANKAASLTVTRRGAQQSIPMRGEVE